MKYIFLVIGITFFTQIATAKTNFEGEVTWGEFMKSSRRSLSPDVIGQDGKSVYLVRDKIPFLGIGDYKKTIEKYSLRNLELQSSARLEANYNGQKLKIIDYFMFGDRPIVYSVFYDKKSRTTYSYLQAISKNNLTLSTPILVNKRIIPQQKGMFGKSMTKDLGNSSTNNRFLRSDDGELGYIVAEIYSEEKVDNNTEIVGFKGKLFDTDLKIVVENEFKLPYTNFSIVRTKLGNDGLIYMAGYPFEVVEDDSRLIKKTNKKFSSDLEILVLDLESGDIEVLKVEMDRKISGFTFNIEEDGAIVVSGLTAIKNKSGVSGAFYVKYDRNFKEIGENFFDFEEDFITQGWSSRSKKKLRKKQEKNDRKGEEKTKPTFYKYRVSDLILKDDGTSTLLAEQYYVRVVTRTTTDANGRTTTTTTYYYYYNDIIALNFDENGELLWKEVIDKYQVSINDGGTYSSFFTVVEGNEINIIYNQRESDAFGTDGMNMAEKQKVKRNTLAVNVVLDEDGEQRKETLFDFEQGHLRLVPKVCSKAGDGIAFIYARAYSRFKKGDQIGVIRY